MMEVRLMHAERDFIPLAEVPRQVRFRDPDAGPQHELAAGEEELWSDLELDTLADAMGGGDRYIFDVARKALFLGPGNDAGTILYRQAILRDCLANAQVVRAIYALVEETIEAKKKHYFGVLTRYPAGILRSAVELMQMMMGMLRRLKGIADAHAGPFRSQGMSELFAMLRREFGEGYMDEIERHLAELRFRGGLLMSAGLGESNESTGYMLRREPDQRPGWLKRLIRRGPRSYSFRLHERDEAGARILSEMHDRGINLVANALAQSTEHVLSFFLVLRVELAFYIGCLNLAERLDTIGTTRSLPRPQPLQPERGQPEAPQSQRPDVPRSAVPDRDADSRAAWPLRFEGLCDPCLALKMGHAVVGNDVDAGGRQVLIVTGANQGGKSSFLRSLGVAQLMMQAGMFVAASAFEAGLCSGVFTHFKREEDATLSGGKLDEELARMDVIAGVVRPRALVLFNESFASTNEREGSEIARQIVRGLLEWGVRVVYVTHLYDFAQGVFEAQRGDALFLRANREPDGTRTFKFTEAGPLETSYGEDLYHEVFGGRP